MYPHILAHTLYAPERICTYYGSDILVRICIMYVLNGQEFQGRVIVNLIRLKVCGSLSLKSDQSNICLFEGYIEMF